MEVSAPALEFRDERVVVGMRADPIPDGGVARADADGAPVETDAGRIDRLRSVYAFELQAGMPRVAEPDNVALSRLFLNVPRKFAQ